MKVSTGTLPQLFLLALLSFQFTLACANTGKAFNINGTAAINDSILTVDSLIQEGDVIKTSKDSSVQIIMEDRSVLDIRENSRFSIDQYKFNKNNPDDDSTTLNLIKGTFRYISGLIGKRGHKNVNIVTGGATLGIRGSFDTISFDGTMITVDTSIGEAIITLPNGETMTITTSNTGTFNVSTSQYSITPTTVPDAVARAASQIAQDPGNADNVSAALSGLSDADSVLVLAALINNAEQLGVTDPASLATALGTVTTVNPAIAVALAYVSSALSPGNSQAFITAISAAAPDQADAIQQAGELGTTLEPAPVITTDGIGAGTGAGAGGVGGGGGGGGGGSTISPN